MSAAVEGPTDDYRSEYVVVLRARSSARFYPGDGFELLVTSPGLGVGPVRLRSFTSWAGEEPKMLPRELVVEARGRATSLDEAVAKFSQLARPVATVAAFVANVRVGPLELHLAYDCSPEKTERPFLEVLVPDEQGGVPPGGRVRPHLMDAVAGAFFGLSEDAPRVSRALHQYELALREWYLGGEWLALSHLWIASENLTKAVMRKEQTERGLTEEELAHAYDIVTDDPDHSSWLYDLGARIRRSVIFEDDSKTFDVAKEARNGIEHGFMELNKANARALKCAHKTFQYIRKTLLSLLGVSDEVVSELLDMRPVDVQSARKVVRGRLIGTAEDAATPGQLYPILEWKSTIESFEQVGERCAKKDKEFFTVQTHPDIQFQPDSYEIVGRLEPGETALELSSDDIEVEDIPAPKGPKLLGRAEALITAAAQANAAVTYSHPALLAFQLLGQGIASFQAAHVLVDAKQPVEALSAVRTLTLAAARFEQMTEAEGPGLGLAVRLALDFLAELPGEHAEHKANLEAGTEAAGVLIPANAPPPEETSVYGSLGAEMAYATSVADCTYGAAALHIAHGPDGAFQPQLEPGPLTDLVASAAVIAAMRLLAGAGAVLQWETEPSTAAELLAEAMRLNYDAAQA